MITYFPITANVLTRGHIECLEILSRKGFVVVGLLTAEALKGYKKELMPFEDRKYILNTLSKAWNNIIVIPQDSLDPTENIRKYRCTAIASGDGWEKEELHAIVALGLDKINIKLKGEGKEKKYSSSKVLNK